jgi:hypothetical protein
MPHLSPTHYETSKCFSPHETYSMVEPPKFLKASQLLITIQTKASQLLITIQTKVLTTWFLKLVVKVTSMLAYKQMRMILNHSPVLCYASMEWR